MEKLVGLVGLVLGAFGIAVVIAVLLAWLTQWLWNNALVGAVDGINPIGFWQALGINFLCNILFKSTTSSK
jgi:hypothetical protein